MVYGSARKCCIVNDYRLHLKVMTFVFTIGVSETKAPRTLAEAIQEVVSEVVRQELQLQHPILREDHSVENIQRNVIPIVPSGEVGASAAVASALIQQFHFQFEIASEIPRCLALSALTLFSLLALTLFSLLILTLIFFVGPDPIFFIGPYSIFFVDPDPNFLCWL